MNVDVTSSLAEQLWTLFVGALLIAWFLASAIHQFRFDWWSAIARRDAFNLLPRWSFFAPKPGQHDFHVVYRDWVDDEHGLWRELVAREVNLSCRWLWNPSRYPNKAISDLSNGLYRALQLSGKEPWAIMLSSSYISLLYVVMTQPPTNSRSNSRQFAIVKTQGFAGDRHLEIAFASEVHRVDA